MLGLVILGAMTRSQMRTGAVLKFQGVWEHETYQNPLHEIPQGMSKVQEEIWKLKNKKV